MNRDREKIVALLGQAAELIMEARSLLNTKKVACDHCDRETFEEWDEAQAHDQFGGVLTKIQRFTVKLTKERAK